MKSIVVFGGSSEPLGQDLCRRLAEAGYSVVNIDHEKSDIEGVTRYPFDAGSSQTAGVLNVMKPDLVINCSWFDDESVTERLDYIKQLCVILEYCEQAGVETYLPWCGTNSLDSVFDAMDDFINVKIRKDEIGVMAELDILKYNQLEPLS